MNRIVTEGTYKRLGQMAVVLSAMLGVARATASDAIPVGRLPAAPAAPSNLHVVLTGDSLVGVAWTDNSTNESGFEVQYSWDYQSTWTKIRVAANSHGAFVPRNTNKRLFVRVRAYRSNTFGTSFSAFSNTVQVYEIPN